MSERLKLIADYLNGAGVSELARGYDLSRKTVYKWLNRYEEQGTEGLDDKSRAPLHHPNVLSLEMERHILALKASKPLWGAPKLRCKLMELVGVERCPAESTVSEVLRRHGLSQRPKRRRRAVPSEAPLSHCLESNRVWCADFKGWFRTRDGCKCTPLTISDGFSRYLLCCQGLNGHTGWATVRPVFIEVFRRYGLPEAIRSDNGPPFASLGLGGLSALSVWWLRLGIAIERIEPGCPQQNGRHERMHRTLKEATANPPRASFKAQQQAFDQFRCEYNDERPHEALGQKTPASVYQASPKAYPERLPEQRGYPREWQTRRVRGAGQMKWNGKDVQVSMALIGQEVGLKPTDDGMWALFFETLELGTFDERTYKVEGIKRLRKSDEKS